MARKSKNYDPVFRINQVGWYSTNSNRRARGMPPLTFDEYMAAKNAGEVMQGKPRKVKPAPKSVKPRERKDLKIKWQAENLRRQKAGLLPIKYDDFVRNWGDWV